jgi:glycosyltransferase involved in cell wall biosynthesis
MSRGELLSIIVPIYNEKKNIRDFFWAVIKYIKCNYELIFVYDFEEDDTLPYIRKHLKNCPRIKLVRNFHGTGVVGAVRTGIKKARGDILIVMAADMTDNPKVIDLMYAKIAEGYDIVAPTRFSKGGIVLGKKDLKSLLSKIAGITTPYILGIPISDLTYSFKMFRGGILKKISINSIGGWEFAEELVIKSYHEGYRIAEIPYTWIDRKRGRSKFKLLKWLPNYIYWYVWGIYKRFKLI